MAAAVADIAEDDEESDGEDTLALDITVQEALQHESKEAVQEALLREAARMIKWQVGQVIDIDTDGGLEEAVIVGPSKSGAAEQMSVRFADGSVSDWDVEDYVARVISAVSSPVVLQQEVVQNGTSNPKTIDRLRRSSVEEAEAAAEAVRAAAEAESEDDESDDEGAEVLDPTMSVEQALKSEDQAAVQDALLREMARKIEWKIGQVIDIDTDAGFEKGASILGPATDGDETQMQVRFADGSVDNWDIDDFVFVALETELTSDDKATGKAAAIALQQEVVKHGTQNVAKIDRLRRASMQPDDAATQAMEAAAMAAAVADIAEDDEESGEEGNSSATASSGASASEEPPRSRLQFDGDVETRTPPTNSDEDGNAEIVGSPPVTPAVTPSAVSVAEQTAPPPAAQEPDEQAQPALSEGVPPPPAEPGHKPTKKEQKAAGKRAKQEEKEAEKARVAKEKQDKLDAIAAEKQRKIDEALAEKARIAQEKQDKIDAIAAEKQRKIDEKAAEKQRKADEKAAAKAAKKAGKK